MVSISTQPQDIPGTTIFDGARAMRGYPVNKMCYSFNEQGNRDEFLRDQEAYCDRYGLDEEQKQAVRDRDVLAMIRAGGNIYCLAKFAGNFGLPVQDVGSQQTGMSVEAFHEKLRQAGA